MAKAISNQPIPPFPPDIDRTAFGHWLSGFTDGEGCFALDKLSRQYKQRRYFVPSATFSIGLRADDKDVLMLIQSFLQCGSLSYYPRLNMVGKPMFMFRIRRTADLATVVIPHFDLHPLQSKKSKDFAIWKGAVTLMHNIVRRPYARVRVGRGMSPKWAESERAQFEELREALRHQREYSALKQPLSA